MNIKDEVGQTSLDRRTVAQLSLAGVSAMAFGVGRDRGARAATPEGFTVETLQEGESTIPGVGRVRLREATWAPSAGMEERPMANDMVCRMVQGDLDVTVDGKPVTRKEGDLWTCHVGMMISDKNNGSVPAVMHVLDLLPE